MSYFVHHGRHVRDRIYSSKVPVQWEEFMLPRPSVFPTTEPSPYVPFLHCLLARLMSRCHGPGRELIL